MEPFARAAPEVSSRSDLEDDVCIPHLTAGVLQSTTRQASAAADRMVRVKLVVSVVGEDQEYLRAWILVRPLHDTCLIVLPTILAISSFMGLLVFR